MTILVTGAYDLPAAADRNRNSIMLAASSGSMGVVDGVHTGMKLSKTTGMGFTIGAGRAAVNGENDSDGTFTVAFTNSVSGSFDDGHSSYDRYDRICIQTYPDNPSTSAADVIVVKGSANASPIPPATPAGALKLYDVKILAGTNAGNGGWNTSLKTDRRQAIGVPEFQDYTPTFGGFDSLGTSAKKEGRYRIDGDKCSVSVHLNPGTGASMGIGAALYFTLPVPAATSNWLSYGRGAIHQPSGADSGIYDLAIVSGNDTAIMWGVNDRGQMVQPGTLAYPFHSDSEIYCNLEYIVDLPE